MKKMYFALALVLLFAPGCYAQEKKGLLIDDYEYAISGGPDGTVDFGAGGDSKVEVTAATDIKHSGKQSMKITYDARPGGYMWVARGFDLDAKNTAWLVKTQDIDWKKYNAFSFYVYGSNSATNVAFDIKDNGKEIWRYIFSDDFTGWKQIVVLFSDFNLRRDWQPENAEKNETMDFPIKSYQFEPKAEAKGVLYVDDMELITK
ncbi:MAG: carbohydrate binding domain-containing protein [Candidatus Omnitrophica bacterium]|nr:carbohydrate binding domain-containing protein [Candidatus Omnitrophota bacterium]